MLVDSISFGAATVLQFFSVCIGIFSTRMGSTNLIMSSISLNELGWEAVMRGCLRSGRPMPNDQSLVIRAVPSHPHSYVFWSREEAIRC